MCTLTPNWRCLGFVSAALYDPIILLSKTNNGTTRTWLPSFLPHTPTHTPHKVMWFPWTECLIWILVDRTSRPQTIASWINNCRVSKRGHSLWLARWLLQLHSSVHSSPILIERQKADAWTLNCKYGMRCIRVLAAATLCFHLRHSTTAAPWRLAGQSPFKSVLVSLHFKRSTRKRNTKIRIKTRIGNNCWVACRHLASSSVLVFLGSSSDTKFNDRCNNNILARQLLAYTR